MTDHNLIFNLLQKPYCSGLSFPSPGDLPNPGIKPMSPASAGGFFTAKPPAKPKAPAKGKERTKESKRKEFKYTGRKTYINC